MSRRERLERRIEKRHEWADKRRATSEAAFNRAHEIADSIPLGQPILVGHHSERHARADVRRIDNAMRAGCESASMANHHEAKADGLERQLAHTIFSDDENAAELLEAKARKLDAKADEMKKANAAFRKAKGAPGWAVCLGLDEDAQSRVEAEALKLFKLCPWEKQPFPAYAINNTRANARRLRERIKDVRAQAERQEKAEAAGGVSVALNVEASYLSIRFSEKPSREMLDALKTAGFGWGGGAWSGYLANLPAACPTDYTSEVELWGLMWAQIHAAQNVGTAA